MKKQFATSSTPNLQKSATEWPMINSYLPVNKGENMEKKDDKYGEYKEILIVWSHEQQRYVEIDAESPEGKIIMKKNLLLNVARKKKQLVPS